MAKRVLLNLKTIRGTLAETAPVIVAPDGTEFPVSAIPLDAFIALLDLQQTATDLRTQQDTNGAEATAEQRRLLLTARDMVSSLLPGFPAGQLALDELFRVIAVVQEANTPGTDKAEVAGDAQPGESTGPI